MTRAVHRALVLLALFASRRALAQAPQVAGDAGAPAPDEDVVQVRGQKTPKSNQTTIGGNEVREIPGAFGDAFRVIEALPGVTPVVSGLPFFFVRGAPPGNNGYYLDGVRVPLLFHVGAGPSVIHPALVEKVDFYPGDYPARYGRFAGSILTGETRRPADEAHAEGNVRLFDAGALVEAPFADGRGTALVAGRYSYTAAIVSLAAPNAILDYWDYQGRVTWKLGAHDTIGVFAFGSYDFFGQKRDDGSTDTALATQFHRIDARWDHELPNHGHLRTAVTLGSDATGTEDLAGVRDRMLSARMLLEQPVSENVLVRGGVDATLDHYDLDASTHVADRMSQEALYPPRNDLALGVHLDAVIHATDRWDITPGIRLDLFESVRQLGGGGASSGAPTANGAVPSVDPRLLSRLRLTKAVTLVSGLGIAHQPPAFFVPVPGLQLGRLDQGLQTAVQSSEGVEVGLPFATTLTSTFFYHRYFGLSDFATTCGVDSSSPVDGSGNGSCLDKRVKGRTLGLELLLRRSLTQKLTGWISYTLSRSTRETSPTSFDLSGTYLDPGRPKQLPTQEIPGDFDRTHVLNVIGAHDLGRNWRAGVRFYYYTGRPYSGTVYGVPLPPFNANRYPDFYRIDARLEKAWAVGKKGRIAVVFEWLNVTLRKEAVDVHCGGNNSSSSVADVLARANQCTFDTIGPVTIPSIGVEGSL